MSTSLKPLSAVPARWVHPEREADQVGRLNSHGSLACTVSEWVGPGLRLVSFPLLVLPKVIIAFLNTGGAFLCLVMTKLNASPLLSSLLCF